MRHTLGASLNMRPHLSSSFLPKPLHVNRGLHSFPTRRSSDLEPTLRSVAILTAVAACRADLGGPHVRSLALAQDRKSTRLNSSHTVTSYAGFRLEKIKDILHPLAVAHRLSIETRYPAPHPLPA